MQFPKPPTSVSEQLKKLQSRGMIIPDTEAAAHYLSHISYYRLTAYWLPFETSHEQHQFRAGTRFEDALNLYIFDRELRLLLMDAIERVEISTRTHWMDALVKKHGAHAHLEPTLFTTTTDRSGKVVWSHSKAVASLTVESQKSREIFILHLRHKYDEALPPLWATCELMTFGEFSKWFTHTQSSALRNQVARAYGMDETTLTSFLHHLAVVRNLCAHHARLWNRDFTFRWKLPSKKPTFLAANLNFDKGRSLYNTLVMLGFMMDIISPHTGWKKRVLDLIVHHGIDPTSMGFPSDYRDRRLWSTTEATS
ncbi:Abi-like [Rhodospirillaceae bacterium LM-1]|nr:Abi-like [Rhodospirillaceae bacterium LM-1]